MKATDVKVSSWTDVSIIYEDKEWSAIWGTYEGCKHMGLRWNGDEESKLGFPVVFGHPVWFTLPHDFVFDALHVLYGKALALEDKEKIRALEDALSEYHEGLSK